MTDPTPTPWKISPVRTTEDTAMIVGGEGFEFGLIADVTEDFDATFIIEAVNNYVLLLTALRRIRSLEAKNVPKFAQQIASEALSRVVPGPVGNAGSGS